MCDYKPRIKARDQNCPEFKIQKILYRRIDNHVFSLEKKKGPVLNIIGVAEIEELDRATRASKVMAVMQTHP